MMGVFVTTDSRGQTYSHFAMVLNSVLCLTSGQMPKCFLICGIILLSTAFHVNCGHSCPDTRLDDISEGVSVSLINETEIDMKEK